MGGNAKNRKPKNGASDGPSNAETDAKPNKTPDFSRAKLLLNKHHQSPTPKDNTKLIAIIALIIIVPTSISWAYNIHLSSLVNKPLNEPRVINPHQYTSPENLDRFWGTYR